MKKNKVSAPCTILLAAINVIVFFILTSQGMTEDGLFLLEHGAMYVPRIMEDEDYYRLFSSMFLHFGFEHLMNNMVTLVLLTIPYRQEHQVQFLGLSGLCCTLQCVIEDG